MQNNRLTIWFLSGFLIYGILAVLFGFFASIGGAIVFGAACFIAAGLCGLKLWFSKMHF